MPGRRVGSEMRAQLCPFSTTGFDPKPHDAGTGRLRAGAG